MNSISQTSPGQGEMMIQMRQASQTRPDDVAAAEKLAARLAVRLRRTEAAQAARIHQIDHAPMARLLGE